MHNNFEELLCTYHDRWYRSYYSSFCGFGCLFTKVCLEDKALWSSDHAIPSIMLIIKEGLLHCETMES